MGRNPTSQRAHSNVALKKTKEKNLALHPCLQAALLSALALAPTASFAQVVVDTTGNDVTVLRSFKTNIVVGTARTSGATIALDLDACPLVQDQGSYELIDCGDELSRGLAKAARFMNYPLAKRPIVLAQKTSDQRGRYSSYYCTLQEIQTGTHALAAVGLGPLQPAMVEAIAIRRGRSVASARFLSVGR